MHTIDQCVGTQVAYRVLPPTTAALHESLTVHQACPGNATRCLCTQTRYKWNTITRSWCYALHVNGTIPGVMLLGLLASFPMQHSNPSLHSSVVAGGSFFENGKRAVSTRATHFSSASLVSKSLRWQIFLRRSAHSPCVYLVNGRGYDARTCY